MGNVTLIVLTKSVKYHNNCVTGINVVDGSWIRLMTHDEVSQGAVSDKLLMYEDGSFVEVLDVIEVKLESKCEDPIHPENYYLDENEYIKKIRKTDFVEVLSLHPEEKKKYVLGSPMPFVNLDFVKHVGHSLTLIKVKNLLLYQNEGALGKKKWKAKFEYEGEEYRGVAMTDPKFYHSVSGVSYEVAYVVLSIGTPWEGKYYKYLSAIFVQRNSAILPTEETIEHKKLDLLEINVDAKPSNGIATFEGYSEFKKELKSKFNIFNIGNYSAESMQDAIDDRAYLKKIKDKLTEKRKELEKISNQPYEIVLDQLDELIDLVKEPYKIIDNFIKHQEKKVKQDEITVYAQNMAESLGKWAKDVLESGAFFNPRWLNASYSERKWKSDINRKIDRAYDDLKQIELLPEEVAKVARTRYFETLSYDTAKRFVDKYVEPSQSKDKALTKDNSNCMADVSSKSVSEERKDDSNNQSAQIANSIIYLERMINGCHPVYNYPIVSDTVINDENVKKCFKFIVEMLSKINNETVTQTKHILIGKYHLKPEFNAVIENMIVQDDIRMGDIQTKVNSNICNMIEESAKVTSYKISNWLLENGYLERNEKNGDSYRIATKKGESIGIINKIFDNGEAGSYMSYRFTPQGQKFVYEHITEIVDYKKS